MGATTGQLGALRDVFRSAALRRLYLAWLATSVGVWGTSVVLGVYAYERGGPVGVGVIALFRTLPGAFAAPFLALAADRNSRRTILLVASALQGAIVAATAGAVAADAPLAAVYALAGLFAIVSPAYKPAQTAWLPRLARTPGELCAANVAASMVLNGGFVVGALSAGALLKGTSPATALVVLAAVMGAAVAPLARIEADPPPPPEPGARPTRELIEGFRTVALDSELRELTVTATCLKALDGAVEVLVVVAALGFLELGSSGVGYLNAAWGIGCIAGGPAVLELLRRGRLTAGLTLGAVILGGSLVLMGVVPAFGVALAAVASFGVGYTVVDVVSETLLQRLAAEHLLARVFGVVKSLSVISAAAASLGTGLLVDAFGARPIVFGAGLLMPALVLWRRKRLALLEAGAPVAARDYGLLRAHAIFAPLPVAACERLARSLEESHPPEGTAVITQGEPGDRFYLIAAGHLDVSVNGSLRQPMGPGEGFGEIALLRDVPRSATVTARAGVVVLALERELFLEVVTGNPRSARAAAALADERKPDS